jgi:hypothetical protein
MFEKCLEGEVGSAILAALATLAILVFLCKVMGLKNIQSK